LAKGDGWIPVMGKSWLLAGLVVALVAVLIYAWSDGGREPLREIVVPVPLQESAR
jgi:hypothetical protein